MGPLLRAHLDPGSVATWAYPAAACAVALLTVMLYELHERHAWATPATAILAAIAANAMQSAIAPDMKRAIDWMQLGSVRFIVAWAGWVVYAALWNGELFFSPRVTEWISFGAAMVGIATMLKWRTLFHAADAGNRRRATWLTAITLACFAFTASHALSTQQMFWHLALVGGVYFANLTLLLLWGVPVSWRFLWCSTAWLLTVTPRLSLLVLVPAYNRGLWLYRFWQRQRFSALRQQPAGEDAAAAARDVELGGAQAKPLAVGPAERGLGPATSAALRDSMAPYVKQVEAVLAAPAIAAAAAAPRVVSGDQLRAAYASVLQEQWKNEERMRMAALSAPPVRRVPPPSPTPKPPPRDDPLDLLIPLPPAPAPANAPSAPASSLESPGSPVAIQETEDAVVDISSLVQLA